jgi:nitroreductase
MGITQVIRERRTIRNFSNKFVDRKDIIEILTDSTWAPNHGFREPWHFMLFIDEGKKAFLNALLKTYEKKKEKLDGSKIEYFKNVPAYLVVLMKEDPRQKQWEEDFAAVSALIQNFQLLAWERGLGVVWKTNNYIYEPEFLQSIGVKPGEKIVGVLYIGYPKEIPNSKPRTPIEKKLIIVDKE